MKVTVANLSSNTLVVPAPLNVALTGGKSVVVILKDQDWKVVQTSAPIQRLVTVKMLSVTPESAAPAPVAPTPPPAPVKVKAEKKPEPPPAPAPAPEPTPEPVVADAPVAPTEPTPDAPASDAPVDASAEDDTKKKKGKKKPASW